jgi:hypothetical protein
MRHTSLMLFIGVAAAGISVSPASATVRIISDPGGPVIDYVERFEAARVSGEPIVIDGACLSACTLAIAGLPSRGWGSAFILCCVIFATPACCIILAQGGRIMAERDLTAREDRFLGLCLVAAAIMVVFIFIVTTS